MASQMTNRHFPEETTFVDLFRDMVSTNYSNLIKVVKPVSENIVFCMGIPRFLISTVHIHRAPI
jgi:hypothetical protein